MFLWERLSEGHWAAHKSDCKVTVFYPLCRTLVLEEAVQVRDLDLSPPVSQLPASQPRPRTVRPLPMAPPNVVELPRIFTTSLDYVHAWHKPSFPEMQERCLDDREVEVPIPHRLFTRTLQPRVHIWEAAGTITCRVEIPPKYFECISFNCFVYNFARATKAFFVLSTRGSSWGKDNWKYRQEQYQPWVC